MGKIRLLRKKLNETKGKIVIKDKFTSKATSKANSKPTSCMLSELLKLKSAQNKQHIRQYSNRDYDIYEGGGGAGYVATMLCREWIDRECPKCGEKCCYEGREVECVGCGG